MSLVICFVSILVSSLPFGFVCAALREDYSNVLEDLKIDENFNEADYSSNAEDYSVNIIQVAETKGGEVLVYVYQPSAETMELPATKISLSTTILGNYSPQLYDLTLLNSSGVFQKYKVNGLKVLKDVVRYYEISEIFRAWNATIDEPAVGGNTTSNKAYKVGQRWTACTLNGNVLYDCLETDVVEITDMFVGFVEYQDGFKLAFRPTTSACQSHFVAFNSDHDIDKLLEADITYTYQHRDYVVYDGVKPRYDTPYTEKNYTLRASDKVEYKTQGTFTHTKYEWNRIETPTQFFNSVETKNVYNMGLVNVTNKRNIVDADKTIINNMQYVLRFYETDYKKDTRKVSVGGAGWVLADYVQETLVTDVAVLRLKFEYEGKVYNLGVVSDMQTGSGNSSSFETWVASMPTWAKYLFYIIIAILGLVLLSLLLKVCGVLKPVLTFIGKVILWICKGVWWLVSSPFVFIKWLVRRE